MINEKAYTKISIEKNGKSVKQGNRKNSKKNTHVQHIKAECAVTF